jgi:hypothetical protein
MTMADQYHLLLPTRLPYDLEEIQKMQSLDCRVASMLPFLREPRYSFFQQMI